VVEKKNAYRIFVATAEGKRQLGKLRHRWKKNIKLDRGVGLVQLVQWTGYGPDDRNTNPGRSRIFLFSTTSRSTLGLIQPSIQCALGVKRLWSETDRSPPSSAEFKNGEALSPLTHTSSCHTA
jgi:hypothetical protein